MNQVASTSWLAVRGIGQLITFDAAHPHGELGEGEWRSADGETLGLIRSASVLIRNDEIHWVGRDADLAQHLPPGVDVPEIDAQGRAVVPGLVDAHTHIVFASDRVHEFRLRVRGTPYEEIARQGGGIVSTVAATRLASEEELVEAARGRLVRLLEWGVTTVEIKSGYGLTTAEELKLLRVVRRLAETAHQTIVPTFLGAHVVAPELRAHRDAYVRQVIDEMLPEVSSQGLAQYCDVFCERGAFTLEETRLICEAAQSHGLGIRLHAEQLSHTGGTRLGVELGAASVDHLEYCSDSDIEMLAHSATTAVLLPGATVFLNQQRWAPARRLLDAGVRVALSTDCNPGSCMTENLPLMGTLGCVRLGMEPAESLAATTLRPAASLGLEGRAGRIRAGARADLLCLDSERYENMFYHYGVNHAAGLIAGGDVVHWKPAGILEDIETSQTASGSHRRDDKCGG